MARHDFSSADEAQLETLGHKSELKRQFSPLAMLGLAFAILNVSPYAPNKRDVFSDDGYDLQSWTALAASLSLALPSGGSTSVLWGMQVSNCSMSKSCD
ncbi:MAG: hypothetical protein Q9187_006952 [Circinaria calcarea]